MKTEVFGVDVPSCLCLAKEDEIPSEVITRMMDATRVGLEFPTTYPTLISSLGTSGAMAACSQFQTAIQDIVSDKDTLNALEMRIYHPEFLDKIDSIINNLPTIASLAISYFSPCSSVSVTLPTVPVSAVLGILVDKKVELIDNRDLLYE